MKAGLDWVSQLGLQTASNWCWLLDGSPAARARLPALSRCLGLLPERRVGSKWEPLTSEHSKRAGSRSYRDNEGLLIELAPLPLLSFIGQGRHSVCPGSRGWRNKPCLFMEEWQDHIAEDLEERNTMLVVFVTSPEVLFYSSSHVSEVQGAFFHKV